MKTGIEITNLDEIMNSMTKDLGSVGLDTTKRAARRIAQFARLNVQVRSKHPTGRLENSITVSNVPNGAEVLVSAPYAQYVEEGTSKMVGKHYLGDAIDAVVPGWIKELERKLKL